MYKMRLLPAVTIALVTSWTVSGQTYTISTFAGGGSTVNNVPGTSAGLYSPSAVAVDKAGNVFFSDIDQHHVLRLDAATGVLTLVAGNGTAGFSGDNGPATSAQLNQPDGIAVDSAGNVYIADLGNNRIRKVANGVITTVAGNGTAGFSGDSGPATSAQLDSPDGVAVDSAGNLYIADTHNFRIRKVANGVIATVAGNGVTTSLFGGFGGDKGPATSAELSWPLGVAVDAAGNLFIADGPNSRIRKVANGVITTVAGGGSVPGIGDNGQAILAQLNVPEGISVDSAGSLYIADTYNHRIRKVAINGVITTVAGNGTQGFSGDNGPATSAQLNFPGAAVDSAGNLYIADLGNGRIRKVASGVITTVAGGFNGDNGLAGSAQLYSPAGVATDSAGNLYIADGSGSRIREVAKGVITTVAGSGTQGSSGDTGQANAAQLNQPSGIAVDSAGTLYIADTGNSRIRKVANGLITTVAGGGSGAGIGDNGPANAAQLNSPASVATDSAGNLYIADKVNQRIRKVSVSNGVITTVAGNGTAGFSGDNGTATNAQLNYPVGVAVDAAGNLYIVDSGSNVIRKVEKGIITTVAGNGTTGFSGDNGPATSAQLSPLAVAVDSAGNLFIADGLNYRIRKVANGVITTVAGNGTAGLSGDNGPATSAQLSPVAVAVDSAGNVYIADSANKRIRLLTPNQSETITFGALGAVIFGVAPFTVTATASSGLTVAFASTTLAVCTVAGTTVTIVAAGTCSITATQAGNAIFDAATPVTGTFTVMLTPGSSQVTTTTSLASSAPTSPFGQNFTLTANVLPANATGTVTFNDGSTALGTATLSGGAATLPVSTCLPAATHSITAVYSGDANNTTSTSAVLTETVNQGTPAPVIKYTGVVPLFSTSNTIQSASWVSIYGCNLASAFSVWAGPGYFPTSLGDVSRVNIDNKPGYIWFVSAGQINVQVPNDTNTGQVSVAVTNANGTSNVVTVTLAKVAPSLLLFDGTHSVGVIITPDGSGFYDANGNPAAAGTGVYDLLGPKGAFAFNTRPARKGETVELFGVGFGPTQTPAPAGQAITPSQITSPITATLGGISASVGSYIVAAGEYQVNVTIPADAPSGDQPLIVTVGGVPAPTVLISVQ